jgi:hypothetical protein
MCQWNNDHKMWGALPIIVWGMYRVVRFFDKSIHFFVDLPCTKTIVRATQAYLAFMSQIRFADSSISQSVLPEYIRPRSIQDLNRGDHFHEKLYAIFIVSYSWRKLYSEEHWTIHRQKSYF